MEIWVLLLVLLAAAWLLLKVQRQPRHAPLPAGRTLFDLRTGDIVQFDGRDWVVEDRLLYDEDGFQWLEYLLRDGPDSRWLAVCEDDWLEVSWLELGPQELSRQLSSSADFPERIEWGGISYQLKEKGRATATSSSRTMNRHLAQCRFADYGAPEQRVLSLEIWSEGDREVTMGRRIDPAAPQLLPGDGRSVYRPSS
jgi:hypothetical protein